MNKKLKNVLMILTISMVVILLFTSCEPEVPKAKPNLNPAPVTTEEEPKKLVIALEDTNGVTIYIDLQKDSTN